MSITELMVSAIKAVGSATMKVTKLTLVVMYRMLTFLVGIFFLPGAYAMRGKFLRGIVVMLLLVLIAIFTAGFGLIIAYPMAVADAATC